MTERIWGEEYRTTYVCIDSYAKGIPKGRFFNPYMKEEESFEGLAPFLIGMEQTLDEMEFPKSFTTVRTFSQLPKSPNPTGQRISRYGEKATFAIRILFRQNSSWQGAVTWMEGKREQTFRSVLELIFLMNSALECPEAS